MFEKPPGLSQSPEKKKIAETPLKEISKEKDEVPSREKKEVSSEEKLQKIYIVTVLMDSLYTHNGKPIVEGKRKGLKVDALEETVVVKAENEEKAKEEAFKYDYGNKKPAEGHGPIYLKEMTSEELDKQAINILVSTDNENRTRLTKEEARIIAANWNAFGKNKFGEDVKEKILSYFGKDMKIPLKLANIEVGMDTEKEKEKKEKEDKLKEEVIKILIQVRQEKRNSLKKEEIKIIVANFKIFDKETRELLYKEFKKDLREPLMKKVVEGK